MNETGGLLRKTFQFLWRNPVVLLPVLVARVLDLLVYAGSSGAAGPLMRAVAPRSVLGGLSGNVNTPILVVANVLTFLPLVCEVLLLTYAMVVSARWAHAVREAGPGAEKSWWAPAGDVARSAALTFGVGGLTAMAGVFLSLRGGVPVRWSYAVTWCFLIMASWFLLPSWLRLLARAEEVRFRDPPKLPAFVAVVLGFVLYAACVRAGVGVQHALQATHKLRGAVGPLLIQLVAACISSIPLAFSFVAMSRYVAERPGWQSE